MLSTTLSFTRITFKPCAPRQGIFKLVFYLIKLSQILASKLLKYILAFLESSKYIYQHVEFKKFTKADLHPR